MEIINFLNEEKKAATELLSSVKAKQDAIVDADLSAIAKCTALENSALIRLEKEDRAFLSYVKEKLGSDWDDSSQEKKKKSWNLLLAQSTDEEIKKVNRLKEEVAGILMEVKGIGQSNQNLINIELDHITFISDLLKTQSPDYSPKGNKKTVDGGAKIVDMRI